MAFEDKVVDNGDGTDYTATVDNIAGIGFAQLVKIIVGAEGAGVPLVLGQATMASSLPVAIASNQGDVPVALNAASLAALETIELGATTLAALETINVTDGGGSLTIDGNVTALATGYDAHDAVITGNPMLMGGAASAAAPASVSADGDAVRAWYLRNGAQATVLTAAGALIGGDATNGLDVDITRTVAPTDLTASGSLTSTASITLSALQGVASVVFDLRGTFVATLQFEGTIDGTNFFALSCLPLPSGTLASSATAAGAWQADVGGYAAVRVRCSAFTSGTVNVTIRASSGVGLVALDASLPAGSAVIGAVTQSGTWNIGTVTPGTAATNLGKARDAAIAATDTGMAMLAARLDTLVTATPASGDYDIPKLNSRAALWVAEDVNPGVSGGTPARLVSAASTNTGFLKASAATVEYVGAQNNGAGWAYLKLYNKASAPTLASDVPIQVHGIPPGGGIVVPYPKGMVLGTGFAYAITGGTADTDTTAIAAGQVVFSAIYR